MREGWEQVAFGDLYAERSRNGLMAPKRVRGSGVPLVNMRELFAYDFISDQEMELAPLPERHSDRWILKEGDLLFARQSLTIEGAGKCAVVVGDLPTRTFESHIIRVRLDPAIAVSRFYYYLFRSPVGSDLVGTIVEQVAAAGIRASDLGRLPVPCPPLAEQRRITAVLGALDDLIETNERVCAAIAQLSRDLFSVLLPDSVAVTRLGDVAAVNPDAIKPGAGDIWYLDIAALRDGGMAGPRRVSWSEAPSRARRGAVGEDILWSTVRPNRRGHTLLLESYDDLVVSTGIAVIRAREIGFAQLYASTDCPEFVDFLMSRAEGSAYPAVRPLDIEAAPIPVLESSAAARYEAVMAPLWKAVGKLRAEKEQARQTRDELLPLLMSGAVSPGGVEVAS